MSIRKRNFFSSLLRLRDNSAILHGGVMELQFKDVLRERRMALGLTLEEVGERVGVSKATVLRWESGEIESVRSDKIALLAQALGVTPAQLMGWTEAQRPESEGPTYTILSRGARQLSEAQQKQLLDVARALFKEAFSDDELGNPPT